MGFRPEIIFICTLSLSILVPSCLGFENAIKFKIYVHSDVKWIKQVETPNTLKQINCPVTNCLITRNPKHAPSISDFDMVLFIAQNDFKRHFKEVEGTRRFNQIYGLRLMEPPHHINSLSYLNHKINWTLSYRTDADIRSQYGYFREIFTNQDMTNGEWRTPDDAPVSSDIQKVVARKTKMIAWFVSNCRAASGRMKLARAINRSIPVDIYGSCGNLKCDRNNGNLCMELLDREYLFYLSFENALCRDYVTEKVFSVMRQNIIPILFNGANVTGLLPPRSYINVEDFGTVEQLSEYLLFLARNPQEYLKYFWWKTFYSAEVFQFSCELCKRLNEWDGESQIRTHDDLERWYKRGTCRGPKIKF